ncbi:MAG TPA: carbon-nitrogen hydrolase family protein [Steroidobacteraceae bacterium]|nr:carbon-nitrogen hydrolase family protein [Steroidobacteraceae bacterium]
MSGTSVKPTPPACRVAAVQMCSGGERDANLATAGRLLQAAAEQGAGVAVLPENFSIMAQRDADRRALAEPDGAGPVQDFLAQAAARLRLWIVAGSVPIANAPGERISQSCLVYSDDGARAARYDKIHLFDVELPDRAESYRESAHMAPGSKVVTVDTPAGRLGLSICYDLRFPELYRRLQAAGAQWFVVPAAFTAPTGEAHWEPLLRARAIENLCYVVASAQYGLHPNGRRTWGHSLIVDYWGRILAQLPDGEGVISATIDRAAQDDARRKFPALSHRVASLAGAA